MFEAISREPTYRKSVVRGVERIKCVAFVLDIVDDDASAVSVATG